MGGAYSVRGYPESDSAGDLGYNFSGELNAPVPFLPQNWRVPFSKSTWWDTVRLVGFIDGGKVFLRNKSSAAAVKDRFLLGTGFGVRADLGRNFSLQLDLGYPIGDDSSDLNQKQAHLSLRGGF